MSTLQKYKENEKKREQANMQDDNKIKQAQYLGSI